MSESGNLTQRILLSPERMSTVKIGAGSLFCTPPSRIGAAEAGFELWSGVFLSPAQVGTRLHSLYTGVGLLPLAGSGGRGAKSGREFERWSWWD
jgi:hypothetical protein